MIKLRQLRASGFRGARFNLSLDFTKDHRSVALYGDNASGKSTITDALEWFIRDKVDHLWKEDCKQDALRNVLCDNTESSEVEVHFSGNGLSSTKSLSPDLKTKQSNNEKDFNVFIDDLRNNHIFLRHAQITSFLNDSKGDKRKAIASIIGYDDILKFRDTIQSTPNTLRRDTGYTTAKSLTDSHKKKFFDLVGEILPDTPSLYKKANELIKPFSLGTTITDEKTYQEVAKALENKITDPDKVKKGLRLDQLKKDCITLNTQLDAVLRSNEAFAESYNELAKDKTVVSKILIDQFLNKGSKIIEEEFFNDPNCPFCLTGYDLGQLQAEVQERIKTIAELKGKYDAAQTAKQTLESALKTAQSLAKNITGEYSDLTKFEKLTTDASSASETLATILQALNKHFAAFETYTVDDGTLKTFKALSTLANKMSVAAKDEALKLALTKQETQILQIITTLNELRRTFADYTQNTILVQLYETQILTLSAIFDSFKTVQNEALQGVLDTISADVETFYKKLHPKECVDKVRLRMVGEEGVEFEYYFHGKPTQPPRKYLSESHLNSLGIVLFLANARLFNNQSKILVLDDVVTSFDTGHRRRLLRLLKEDFSDWQILLLTHEALWFDLIKTELSQSGWLFKELHWDDENGIQLEQSAESLRALIEMKRAKHDVSNDIRKLLEALLKEICCSLEVPVAFRFNDVNEKRMPGELLNQLRATLKRKSPDLSTNTIFSNLEGSNLISNVGSHDNKQTIVRGDIDVALEDIDEIATLFHCGECKKYVQAENTFPGEKKISCTCGKLKLDWKT